MQDFDVLARTAASQHGLLTRDQLNAGGLGRRSIDRMLAKGQLERLRPRVYRVAGAPVCWEQDICAATYSIGGLAVASHRSALRLWGLRDIDDELEVAVPSHRRSRPTGVIVHRSVDLHAEDRTVINAVPVTSAARTLADAGLIFPDHEVRRLVGQGLISGIVSRDELWQIRRRVGEHGRTGVGALERALESLPDLAGAESEPEVELAGILVGAGLPMPAAQHEVMVAGRCYRIDLCYPDARVALEYDGFDPHVTVEAFERDRRRQNALLLEGWFFLRYSWADLRKRPGAVVAETRSALTRDL